MNKLSTIKVGISIGDIAGIGPEIVLKALSDPEVLHSCTPIVYAGEDLIRRMASLLKLDVEMNVIQHCSESAENQLNVLKAWDDDVEYKPGKPNRLSGAHALMSLEKVVEDLSAGELDAMVTAPIDKQNIQSEKFKFPGHTEYLAKSADVEEYLMLLISDGLRVGVVTGHIPVSRIAEQLSEKAIIQKLEVIHASLKQDFGIENPRIAVFGLNPHAGDQGLIGREEIEVIIPALEKAKQAGILAEGPFPADGFFGSSKHKTYDAILAMYHDQGLVPFKALSFGSGVNFTAGLPFIRTSPDHGTAFDIAGKGIADESSFKEALSTAIQISNRRKSRDGSYPE